MGTMMKQPLLGLSALLLVAYFGAYAVYAVFFDFSFLEGAPVYFPDADPGGMFMAWIPMSFCEFRSGKGD